MDPRPRATCGTTLVPVSDMLGVPSVGSGVTARMVVGGVTLERKGPRALLDGFLSLASGMPAAMETVASWTGRSGRGGATSSLMSGKFLPSISGGSMLDKRFFGHIHANENGFFVCGDQMPGCVPRASHVGVPALRGGSSSCFLSKTEDQSERLECLVNLSFTAQLFRHRGIVVTREPIIPSQNIWERSRCAQ